MQWRSSQTAIKRYRTEPSTATLSPARVILTGCSAHCLQSVVDTSSAMEELRREVFAVQQQLVPLTARLEAYAHAQAACTCCLTLSSR